MTQREKLLRKIRNNPKNVTFDDLTAALEGLGFPLMRITASHHIYRVGKRTVSIPKPKQGPQTKSYVVQLVLDALDEYFESQ